MDIGKIVLEWSKRYRDAKWMVEYLQTRVKALEKAVTEMGAEIAEMKAGEKDLVTLSGVLNEYIKEDVEHAKWVLADIHGTVKAAAERGYHPATYPLGPEGHHNLNQWRGHWVTLPPVVWAIFQRGRQGMGIEVCEEEMSMPYHPMLRRSAVATMMVDGVAVAITTAGPNL